MIPISIQLYTLRELAAKDFPGVLRNLSEIGYSGVEYAGLHGYSSKEIRSIIDELGIKSSSAHTALPTAENIGELADTYGTLGTNMLITGFGYNEFKDYDSCKRTAEMFETAAAVAKSHGFEFGMHNHEHEFTVLDDGKLAYDVVLELAPNIFSELDVYWAEYGNADPAKLVAKHASRLPVLHIKDGNLGPTKNMTAVGSGKLDMLAIIGAADPSVTKWLIVELDHCDTDMLEAVKDSYTYLIENKLSSGNK